MSLRLSLIDDDGTEYVVAQNVSLASFKNLRTSQPFITQTLALLKRIATATPRTRGRLTSGARDRKVNP